MMAERDGYVTVHPSLNPAARVTFNIAVTVLGLMEAGMQPLYVRVSVADYKALLARDGLEQRSIRVSAAESLRARVHGFDLPVEADARVPYDDAWVMARPVELGVA